MAMAGMVFTFLALVQLAAPGGGLGSLKIGMLAAEGTPPSVEERIGWPYCASAASFAIDDLKRDGIIPASTDIKLIWRNDESKENVGLWKTIDLIEIDQCDMIIGSPSALAARVSAFYTGFRNQPQMCWACSNSELSVKAAYPTLVRTFADFGSLGSVLWKVFALYGWRRTAFWMNDDFEVCRNSKMAIINNFLVMNITIAEQIMFTSQLYTFEFVQQSLRRLQNQARVIIVCGYDFNVRDFIMEAARMGMNMSTGYVFWVTNSAYDIVTYRGWIANDARNEEAKSAWRSVLELLVDVSSPEIQRLRDLIPLRMTQPPYNNSKAITLGKRGCVFAPYLYDSMYLYGRFVNWSLTNNVNYRDGKAFFDYFRDSRFQGMTGDIVFNSNADREATFTIYQIDAAHDNYSMLMAINPLSSLAINESLRFFNPPRWFTPDGTPPKDAPLCGFWNEFCPETGSQESNSNSTRTLSPHLSQRAASVHRQRQQAMRMLQSTWQVAADDLRFLKNMPSCSLYSIKSSTTVYNRDQNVATVASGLVVFVKQFPMHSTWHGTLPQQDIILLNTMRQLNHENVNQFVGVCCLPDHLCLLYTFCNKGSLTDILANENIKIDADFQASFLLDIVEGVVFLHHSPLRCLGNVKSANCLVDNRWIVKITDHGVDRVKRMFGVDGRAADEEEDGSDNWYQGLLWTAPECLAIPTSVAAVPSPKGDIYSLAMVMYEILFRVMPFDSDDNSKFRPKDIIDRVRNCERPSFRPSVDPDVAPNPQNTTALMRAYPELVKLIQTCWSDEPAARPDASALRATLRSMLSTFRRNLIDSVLQKLEKYAANLEHIVDDRSQQLMDEKKRTEQLLYRIMPQTVADQLKSGLIVLPETYDDVTVYFSDIVGFTTLSAQSTPMQVVQLLNDLYSMFDDVIGQHDVYKVETIGDAYMVASGLPVLNGRRHARNIADMALDLLSAVMSFRVAHRPDEQLQLRQGIHTGPVAAGIVGTIMPRYCLFGDTVNTASRMESSGMGLHIQCSATTHDALELLGVYLMKRRGEIQVKGKGVQSTYWLHGRQGYSKPLPGVCCAEPL